MKIKTTTTLLAMALISLIATSALAGESKILAGARMHVEHSLFTDIPYGDDDMSYGLAYEYVEKDASWQIAVMYAPDVTGNTTTDYIVTPQINLVFRDRMWRGGFGVLKSYIDDTVTGTDWSDEYWQTFLGLDIPLGSLSLSIDAYYSMGSLGDISDVDLDDLDYGIWITTPF